MMTNSTYKRLTTYNKEFEHASMTDTHGEDTCKTIARHVERLYELENAIENGTLVFLPCKVGDEFWCFAEYYSIREGWVNEIAKHTVSEIRIRNNVIYLYDENDEEYDTSDIILYFTKEAAEKALEELEK